jgi:hypothetical protein
VVKLRWFTLGAAVALWAAGPRSACAHPEQAPALVNRYLTVAPAGTRLGLHLELLFGTVPAAEQRRIMDRDHDGTISLQERSAEVRAWSQRADQLARLTIDGRAVPIPLVAQVDLDGDDTTSSKPLLIDLAGQIDLGPGEHKIEIDAGPDLPRMGETEIVLDAANPWVLRTTFDDKGQAQGVQKLVRHPGPRAQPSDRRGATFVIDSAGPAESNDANPALPIVMVVFSLVLGVGLVGLVRRLERIRRATGTPDSTPSAPPAPQSPK